MSKRADINKIKFLTKTRGENCIKNEYYIDDVLIERGLNYDKIILYRRTDKGCRLFWEKMFQKTEKRKKNEKEKGKKVSNPIQNTKNQVKK